MNVVVFASGIDIGIGSSIGSNSTPAGHCHTVA